MFNTIQATLIDDQRDPGGIVSHAWTKAMQDITQVGLLVSFVVIGWILTSLLLRAISAAAADPRHKFVGKLPVLGEEMTNEVDVVQPGLPLDVKHAHSGIALLEQYGVFSSTPGAWIAKGHEDTGEGLVATQSEAPLMPRGVIGSRSPCKLLLLPYRSPTSAGDSFGDFLTAIT
jgi:hypothetical protein